MNEDWTLFKWLKLSWNVRIFGDLQVGWGIVDGLLNLLLFSSQSCLILCDLIDCSMPGFPVLQHLPEFAQTQVHGVGAAIQPSHPLPPHSSFAFTLSQHQGLFQWVSSLHQVAKVLGFQLQCQSFQWIFRTDFSFRMDWMDLLVIQGALKSFLQHDSSKAQFCIAKLYSPNLTSIHDY